MRTMATMRQVPHPEKLYIQINDESPDTLGFSFNDDLTNDKGLDPNAFDQETLLRAEQMLANVFALVNRLRTNSEPIKSI